MKAAVLYQYETPLTVEDVDLESPKAGEVRVKIVANGICHSDYSVIHGVLRSPLPVVLGHEGASIVEEVGPEVTLVKRGDHVVLSLVSRWPHADQHLALTLQIDAVTSFPAAVVQPSARSRPFP